MNGISLGCAGIVLESGTAYSQKLLAHKDENFVLGLHVVDEVKDVGLLLLLLDKQDCLVNRVHRLARGEERRGEDRVKVCQIDREQR